MAKVLTKLLKHSSIVQLQYSGLFNLHDKMRYAYNGIKMPLSSPAVCVAAWKRLDIEIRI